MFDDDDDDDNDDDDDDFLTQTWSTVTGRRH